MRHTANGLILIVCVALCFAASAQGAIVTWTDWTSASANPDTVIGQMGGITVTYTGDYYGVQLGTGTNYWTEPNPSSLPYTGSALIDNAPTPSELIQLEVPATHTIVFSQPVYMPVMAILSLGRLASGYAVSYDFDKSFTVLSEGQGQFGDGNYQLLSGDVLVGNELHCAIQFDGLVSSISWDSAPSEFWHGITVGMLPIPEPATFIVWSLLGVGSWLGVRVARRRRFAPAGRQPWSPENRQAIHDIIAHRGRN